MDMVESDEDSGRPSVAERELRFSVAPSSHASHMIYATPPSPSMPIIGICSLSFMLMIVHDLAHIWFLPFPSFLTIASSASGLPQYTLWLLGSDSW